MAICLSQGVKAESDATQSFQMEEPVKFDTKNALKSQVIRRNVPSYRVIRAYSKSTQQYQLERQRRRKGHGATVNKGLTFGQAARKLGVPTKTIQRDMAKLERHLKGQINRKRYLLEKEQRERLDALSTETFLERWRMLSNLMFTTRKLSKKQGHEQHNRILFIDMDLMTPQGFPQLRLDKDHASFKTPYHFRFVAVKNGAFQPLGGITIS